MKSKREERLSTEKMLPLILRMSLPCVAAQLVNLLYSIVDRIFIGHIDCIGTDALAGIGVTGSIIILITAFSAIVGVGGAPLASIALGKGDRERAGYILGNGFVLLIIFAIVSSVVTYIFMEPILLFIGASQNTLQFGMEYLSIYLTGTVFVLITTGLNSFITAQGCPSVAMWSVVAGALVNIILDYIFISVLGFGVKGAAIATIIAQGVSAVWILKFLFSKEATLQLEKRFMILSKRVVLAILALGISPFVMALTEAIVGFVLNGSLKTYGDIHISSMAIIQSALLALSIPMTGFSQGFAPIVSYNFGNGNSARVKECFKISLIFMVVFNFVLTLFMILFPGVVASIFSSDELLISTVESVMPTFFFGMTLFGLQRTCQNMFIALGEAKISIFIAILRKVILLIPLAIILPKYIGVMGIYWAESVSDATAALCCTAIFFATFEKILKRNSKK